MRCIHIFAHTPSCIVKLRYYINISRYQLVNVYVFFDTGGGTTLHHTCTDCWVIPLESNSRSRVSSREQVPYPTWGKEKSSTQKSLFVYREGKMMNDLYQWISHCAIQTRQWIIDLIIVYPEVLIPKQTSDLHLIMSKMAERYRKILFNQIKFKDWAISSFPVFLSLLHSHENRDVNHWVSEDF